MAEILAGEGDTNDHDPSDGFVEVTPRKLALLNLCDCKEQLERWKEEPLRLIQAAKSAHLAMQAALIDALAGTASIGAYDEKLRAEYLAYFEDSRTGEATPPKSDRIMSFSRLLARAVEHPLEWSGRRLDVSADEIEALDRLTHVRDRVEHPRPHIHLIEPAFIAGSLPVAAQLALKLLDVCSHAYEEEERAGVQGTVSAIASLCSAVSGSDVDGASPLESDTTNPLP